ncbi:MAG: response regulator transcription factor [Ardenticatenaceae bacterium]
MSKKVLIVDDEINIVMALEFLMEQAGYQTKVAYNGRDALKIAAEFAPDLILLDVMMPKVNGYDVCQQIRNRTSHATWQQPKIVMLTAKGRDAEITKGLALGADTYISKPFSTRDLVANVQKLLGG